MNWVASLQLWLLFEGAALTCGYIVVDVVTTVILFRMAARRWFPVPLCFLHGALVTFHAGSFFNTGDVYWEKFLLNRAFDIELAYINACALFRIIVMARARRAARA